MRTGQNVAHLGEYGLGYPDLDCGAHALEEGPSRAVISVADVDEGQDVGGVEKKPVLAQELDRWPRFGVP